MRSKSTQCRQTAALRTKRNLIKRNKLMYVKHIPWYTKFAFARLFVAVGIRFGGNSAHKACLGFHKR
jgi:hypothetical protein